MAFIKLSLAALLLFVSLGAGFLFALVGLWSALAFVLFAAIVTFTFRSVHRGGQDRVYFVAYSLALVCEVVLLGVCTDQLWLGFRKIMDGYAAPSLTQLLIAALPVLLYRACLGRFAAKREA